MQNNENNKNAVELELMKQFSLGDTTAFKEIFILYYSKLLWFTERYVKSKDIADDIVKELFIELWKKRKHIKIKSSLQSYLYTSAKNRALNFIRQSNTFRNHALLQSFNEEELYIVNRKIKSPSEQVESNEFEDAVTDAIESLPERCKLIFNLRREQGLSYSEIADILEISIKTVENQISKAFKILRVQLSHFLTFIILSKII